jgi:hypothetical protein
VRLEVGCRLQIASGFNIGSLKSHTPPIHNPNYTPADPQFQLQTALVLREERPWNCELPSTKSKNHIANWLIRLLAQIVSTFGDSMVTQEVDLERTMRKLDLSAAERKGIKIDMMKGLMEAEDDWQAVGLGDETDLC